MAQRLKNIVRFTGITPNTPTVLPHGLQLANGVRLVPDYAEPDRAGFTVTANDTNVTVTGNGTAVDVLCESWHTFERAFGSSGITELVPQPFVPGSGSSSSSFNNFVFRPGEPAPSGNVFATWSALVAALPTVGGFKTIQFDDSLAACVIPAGTYNMDECEWTGFFNLASAVTPTVSIADGASFTNFRKIGGDLSVVNLNTVTAPVVIAAGGGGFASIFELGTGLTGDFPSIVNNGAAPFFDCSALLVDQRFLIRMQGSISGTSPAIAFGASEGSLALTVYDAARLHANMVTGGAALVSRIAVFQSGSGGQVCRQPNWNGSISYGRPSPNGTFDFAVVPWQRMWMFPDPVDQTSPSPSAAAFTPATGLGMNSCYRFDTTADPINQVLPIIRAAAPATGLFNTTPGVIESAGMVVIIKNEVGANAVNVSPDGTNPDTIDGGAGPIVVPAGGSRTFMSDGISNWSVVGGYL